MKRAAAKNLNEMRPMYSKWGHPVDADGNVAEKQITAAYKMRYDQITGIGSEVAGSATSGAISNIGNALIGRE